MQFILKIKSLNLDSFAFFFSFLYAGSNAETVMLKDAGSNAYNYSLKDAGSDEKYSSKK